MVKNFLKKAGAFALITSLLMVSCPTVSFADYPIFSQQYTADPTAVEYNGRLYVYLSHDVDITPDQKSYNIPEVYCISTDDLKNWTDHGVVFNAKRDSKWAGVSWAPSIIYRNNKFYLYYGNGGNGLGVAVSDSPTGPFKDNRSGALVTINTPGVQPAPNIWLFDPGAFVDDDGQAYLYFGGNGQNNVRCIKLGSDMVSTVGSAYQLSAPRFFEASEMMKYNGNYYYMYASDFSQGASKIEYMMSKSPTSGFTYKGVVLPQPPDNYSNNNHANPVKFKGNYYMVYHNRNLGKQRGVETNYQRNAAIDQMFFNADGTIKQVVPTVDGLKQLKNVDPFVKNTAVNMYKESGTETEECTEGGRNVSYIHNGDWIQVKGVDFKNGATGFEARVASNTTGGNIEIRLGGPTGKLVGTCNVPSTGGWQTYTTKTCSISGATGVNDVCFRFTGSGDFLMNFSSWKFTSNSVTNPPVTPTPTNNSNIVYGDVNGDGAANSIDFGLMRQCLLGTIQNFPSANGMKAADLDESGAFNSLDFGYMRQYILGIINNLPVRK